MSKILVTGGLGYIGSHVTIELLNEGFDVHIIDNLSNSSISVLDNLKKISGKKIEFTNIDLKDKHKVNQFFKKNNDIKDVIHFAAYKAVGESVEKPLKYYDNNLSPIIYILDELKKNNSSTFIFSSSCTVYGESKKMPITEKNDIKKAVSPYGNSKQIGEEIIKDFSKSNKNFNSISLRYFNPIGAHESSLIGELSINKPQNLVPFITQTAIGLRDELLIFGNDYNTKDGTCIRDYIHVIDVARLM